MIQTENLPTKIAHLEYQKGHFSEALIWANKVARESLSKCNIPEWLEALRLILLCGFELENLSAFEQHLIQLHKFEMEHTGFESASAQYLIAHYLLIKKADEAATAIDRAITTATLTQNLLYLARSMTLAVHYYSIEPHRNLTRVIENLDKIDIIIKELALDDLMITSLVLRSYANGSRRQFERAFDLIWKAYEKAQHSGYQIVMPTILAQIARLYQQQNRQDFFQMYADQALRGVHEKTHPRLYRQISEFCNFYSVKPISAYDFILDEEHNSLHERDKGFIDFKSQHILLDLTILFLKNPGTRFSKEDLIEQIWKQVYDADTHDNLIYVSIKRLRFLLEPNSESPKYILRDRQGYYLNSQTQIQFKLREDTKT
ncbi:MAG: winged helix-turn-helix domain-containing protein [Pseudobdellovibrionaceae bacterium]